MPKLSEFSLKIIEMIQKIPKGCVATYGQIASLSGNPQGARHVVRILHSSSRKRDLPWHRIVNRNGEISLSPGQGYEIQKQLLEQEGIFFNERDRIDFEKFLWKPLGSH